MKNKTEIRNSKINNWATRRLHFTCGLLMAVILYFDLSIPLGVAIGVVYIAVVLISLQSPQNSVTVLISIGCSILMIGVFFYQPPVTEMWKVIFNRAIALFAIWMTAILGMQRNKALQKRETVLREREIALEDVRILRGLLPICSSCKKIRNDEGYWIQIEEYIRVHSEAIFTHGICQECVKRLYPQYYEEE
jgi:hypothetical protein